MRYKLFIFLTFVLSCDAVDIEPEPEILLNKFSFYTALTTKVNTTNLLRKIALSGEIVDAAYECRLLEAGFFYSQSKDLLYETSATYSSLLINPNVTQIPIDEIKLNETKGSFQDTYEFAIEEVDKTYFFRAYAFFKNSCDDPEYERVYLEQISTAQEITLRDGWYKVPFEGDLWKRIGSVAIEMGNKIIIGGGCEFDGFCMANIKEYPFLEFTNNNNNEENLLRALETPFEFSPTEDDLFNRRDAVAFAIGDSIYFGTGQTDEILNNFYSFDINNQNNFATPLTPPEEFSTRTEAVGFAINKKGYVGLGKQSSFQLYDDFWQFDPLATSPDKKWVKMSVTIDPASEMQTFTARSEAIGFLANDEYGIIGGGFDIGFQSLTDFWEFRPNADSALATLKYIGSIPEKNEVKTRLEGGIGFELDGALYVGLGSKTNLFYQFKDNAWNEVKPHPGFNTFNGTGFSLNGRGYFFSGNEIDDNGNGKVSNDLWVYVPEK